MPSRIGSPRPFRRPTSFIDPGRRAAVVKISTPSREIGGKTFYLLHSNEKYDMLLGDLPASCAAGGEASLALMAALNMRRKGQH